MLRSQLTYANVAATIALAVAVGGGSAYAAGKIGASRIGYHAVTAPKIDFNAVTGSKVRNRSLSGRDLRDGTVTSGDIRNGTLKSQDFGANQLPQGPKGDAGAPAIDLHGTVSSAGALSNGKGVAAVSAGAGATYTVTLDRDVSKCSPVATVGDAAGGIVSAGPGGGAQQVTFRTHDLAGAAGEHAFAFAVYC